MEEKVQRTKATKKFVQYYTAEKRKAKQKKKVDHQTTFPS